MIDYEIKEVPNLKIVNFKFIYAIIYMGDYKSKKVPDETKILNRF
ncbi:hypothetical protein [Methanosarcina siciliae]|nr:hypothetical protein [Methanosarcina siciliae]